MDRGVYGGRPVATTALMLAVALVAAYFAVAFDRQENRPPVASVPSIPPTPTITTDDFVAQVASAVVEELDLPPAAEGQIVELLTDEGQPGVIVVPPAPSTSSPPPSTTTTTTAPPPTTRPAAALIDPQDIVDLVHGADDP